MRSPLRIYQVDAFTQRTLSGNPAAVIPLDAWLPDTELQAIALENNLSETAFFVDGNSGCELRWFTPTVEVELCGHATLASAWVFLNHLAPDREQVSFQTRSGELTVRREDGLLVMNFPRWQLAPVAEPPAELAQGLGAGAAEVFTKAEGDNWFCVFERESQILGLEPDFTLLQTLHPAGVVVTAPGESSDIASRYFAPGYGIDEDPVTGSIHCGLTPLWCERLETDHIHARQVSARGGDLWCTQRGNRVDIAGYAVLYLHGEICLSA